MYSEEITIQVIEMLVQTSDVELVKLFITEVVGSKTSTGYCYRNEPVTLFGLKYSATENVFCDLVKCVPWDEIKPLLENIIPQCKLEQYRSWLNVARSSGIKDLINKVAEVICQKISEKKWSPQTEDDINLMVLLCQCIFEDDSLFAAWWGPKFSAFTNRAGRDWITDDSDQ